MKNLSTLIDFMNEFKDENACLKYLTEKRKKSGLVCPHCGHEKVYTFSDGKTWKCAACRQKFNIKTGTIFAGSKISLQKWFLAIFLLTTNKKGISSVQLAEQLGVTQKTAWFMDHRIRETYKQGREKLSGTIEVDETYVGGKEKNKHKSKRQEGTQGRSCKAKTPVIGMIERGGKLKAVKSDNVRRITIKELLQDLTEIKDSTIIADEYRVYNGIADKRVNHSTGEYVIDTSHTNTIEGFWGILKRGILGIYHFVSPKHLQRYVDEFVFRYNDREYTGFEKIDNCLNKLIDTRLTYKDLIDG